MKGIRSFLTAFLIMGSVVAFTAQARAAEGDISTRIAAAIQAAAQAQLGAQSTRVQVTLVRSDRATALAQKLAHPKQTSLVVSPSKRLMGDILVPVNFVTNHQVVATATVSVSIQAWGPVVVAARDIRRSQVIDSSDVRVVEREITRLSEQRLSKAAEAVGRQATLLIPTGAVVTRSVVKVKPMIAKGDRVLLVGKASGIRIETPGVALEDGYQNGSIQVKSQYNKMLVGRVRGDQTVEVRLY